LIALNPFFQLLQVIPSLEEAVRIPMMLCKPAQIWLQRGRMQRQFQDHQRRRSAELLLPTKVQVHFFRPPRFLINPYRVAHTIQKLT